MNDSYVSIVNVLGTYARLIDNADFDGVGAIFADAKVTHQTEEGLLTLDGAAAVAGFFRNSAPDGGDGTPRTKHLIFNIVADIDEQRGTAEVTSEAMVFQSRAGIMAIVPIMAGGYEDRFERRDGTWRIVHRHLTVHFVGDTSHHRSTDEIPESESAATTSH